MTGKKRTKDHRIRARERGGVIVYALITDPETVKAWGELQKVFGNNRDAVEDAILTSYKQIKGYT